MTKQGWGTENLLTQRADTFPGSSLNSLRILFSGISEKQTKVKISEWELFDNFKELNGENSQPVFICLLGKFNLFLNGQQIHLPGGGKSETLLAYLGLQADGLVHRERLIQAIWPNSDLIHGFRSLNTLVYNLNKLLAPALQSSAAVSHEDCYYRLNVEAGIQVDVTYFENLVSTGNRYRVAGDKTASIAAYQKAIELYRDDLYLIEDPETLMERERLRTTYLTLLSQMADFYFDAGDYNNCLRFVRHLLIRDTYREDAHRLVMRCYVRQGERANALRQYQLCRDLLQAEFDARPEAATTALFDQIRNNPDSI